MIHQTPRRAAAALLGYFIQWWQRSLLCHQTLKVVSDNSRELRVGDVVKLSDWLEKVPCRVIRVLEDGTPVVELPRMLLDEFDASWSLGDYARVPINGNWVAENLDDLDA